MCGKGFPILHSLAAHTWHPSTGKVGAGGPGIQSHLHLHSKFQASLDYMRLCLKNANNKIINIKNQSIQGGFSW